MRSDLFGTVNPGKLEFVGRFSSLLDWCFLWGVICFSVTMIVILHRRVTFVEEVCKEVLSVCRKYLGRSLVR